VGRPAKGGYFDNISPTTGQVICQIARSQAEDVERAIDAAHAAADKWGRTAVAQRARFSTSVADRIEQYLPFLAAVETYDNGKPIRETNLADLPLAVDHFRYFASCVRAQEGSLGELDDDTVAYHYHEPLGVVGQIIPWNFPILDGGMETRAGAGRRQCRRDQAGRTDAHVAAGAGRAGAGSAAAGRAEYRQRLRAGGRQAAGRQSAHRKIAFTGETTTGRLIMQYASENIIPVTLELGGKSPNIFFADVMREDDDFVDKALEGFAMFALNQGEVCTCPSRALVQKSIYDRFMERAVKRVEAIRQGDPYEMSTQIGAQASNDQYEKILSYIDIGKKEGAKVLTGGVANKLSGDLAGGYYIKPTVFEGHNKMRVFQEEIFGPVVSVTTFDTPRRRSRSPTTRCMAWAPAYGPATSTPPIASAAASRPAASGPIAITRIPRMRRSAATRSPVSAAKPTR
jgi:aldehyde dehydrogenase